MHHSLCSFIALWCGCGAVLQAAGRCDVTVSLLQDRYAMIEREVVMPRQIEKQFFGTHRNQQ